MSRNNIKLTRKSEAKIRARFNNKLEEFESKSLEELKEMYNTVKMSSTDRFALVNVTQKKLEEKMSAELKEAAKDDSTDEE